MLFDQLFVAPLKVRKAQTRLEQAQKNFETYAPACSAEVRAAGPK